MRAIHWRVRLLDLVSFCFVHGSLVLDYITRGETFTRKAEIPMVTVVSETLFAQMAFSFDWNQVGV